MNSIQKLLILIAAPLFTACSTNTVDGPDTQPQTNHQYSRLNYKIQVERSGAKFFCKTMQSGLKQDAWVEDGRRRGQKTSVLNEPAAGLPLFLHLRYGPDFQALRIRGISDSNGKAVIDLEPHLGKLVADVPVEIRIRPDLSPGSSIIDWQGSSNVVDMVVNTRDLGVAWDQPKDLSTDGNTELGPRL